MKKPENYYNHKAVNCSLLSQNGYEIIEKIGQGTFGEVYKMFDQSSSSIKVMKKNKKEDGVILMQKQFGILKEMKRSDGFARVEGSYNQENESIMMTYLGQDLQQTISHCMINTISMKRIAYQLVLRFKELHHKGYVHRDLKPENILFGNKNCPHKIFLVDFGLASPYKKEATHARQLYHGQIGTLRFCSIASHKFLEQFPKDDLESLAYVLIYLINKKLPWTDLKDSAALKEEDKIKEIKLIKQQASLQSLSNGVSCLRKYLTYVKNLKIGQNIDYEQILSFFQVEGCQDEYCYNFCKENCFAKAFQVSYLIKKENQFLKEKVFKQNFDEEPSANQIKFY